MEGLILRAPLRMVVMPNRLLAAALVAAAQRLAGRVVLLRAGHGLHADAIQVTYVVLTVMFAGAYAAIDLLMALIQHFHPLLVISMADFRCAIHAIEGNFDGVFKLLSGNILQFFIDADIYVSKSKWENLNFPLKTSWDAETFMSLWQRWPKPSIYMCCPQQPSHRRSLRPKNKEPVRLQPVTCDARQIPLNAATFRS